MGRPTYPSVNDADNQRLPGRRLPERQLAGGSRFDATEAAVATVVVDRQTHKITCVAGWFDPRRWGVSTLGFARGLDRCRARAGGACRDVVTSADVSLRALPVARSLIVSGRSGVSGACADVIQSQYRDEYPRLEGRHSLGRGPSAGDLSD
jgi:hypothetical protein